MSAILKTLRVLLTAEGKGFEEQLKASGKHLKGFQDEIGKTTKIVAGVGLALTGAGIAASKALDFAEQGANVSQLKDSFSNLRDEVGATPAVLNEMRSAVNYTVDDVQLMASFQTMLAGTTGEVSTAFANAMPKLALYAKAANKLNPELGDTSFLMESIATGVKRQSQQVIDNLGITFKASEAYEEYSATIGKSADELTNEEKTLAFLNKTLEAGNVLLDQAGGTAVAASDDYQQLDVTIKNLTDSTAEYANRGLQPAVQWLNAAIQDSLSFGDVQKALDDAEKAGLITKQMNNQLEADARWGRKEDEEILETLAWLEKEHNARLEEKKTILPGVHSAVDGWAAGMREAKDAAEGLAEETESVALAILNVGKATLGKQQLELLGEAYQEGVLTQMEYEHAARGIMEQWLDMEPAEASAGIALGKLKKDFEDGKLTALEYAQAVAAIGGSLYDLDGKEFNAKFTVDIIQKGSLPPGFKGGSNNGGDVTIYERQFGGPVKAYEPYIVGERGAEMFVPDRNGFILSTRDAMRAVAGSGLRIDNFNINANGRDDAESLYRGFMQRLERDLGFNRSSGLSYMRS